MDILITDSMLKEHLKTNASSEEIAKYLSLCGPSIEKISKVGRETVYHIEVTTNRVDTASAYGIAREAAAILPQFGKTASLKEIKNKPVKTSGSIGINILPNKKMCQRFVAVKIQDVKIGDSPKYIAERLTSCQIRPINNAVDITNYIMLMYGVPMHAFDLDLIDQIKIDLAKPGERFKTLDDKDHSAMGGEIVFRNGSGEIIDLPGIMGEKKTSISNSTKNILLVSEHIDPLKVRWASLTHETRTMAATINEKNPDPSQIDSAIKVALSLFEETKTGKTFSEIYDWYPEKRNEKIIEVKEDFLENFLGIKLSAKNIQEKLNLLHISATHSNGIFLCKVPSFRSADIEEPEDIAEEIARIYGYHNLPSVLPPFTPTLRPIDTRYSFENKLKNILKGFGGIEIYTPSMTSKEIAQGSEPAMPPLRIKNPLGADGEYMRTVLHPSLLNAAYLNKHTKAPFFLFEIASVYIGKKSKLPEEVTKIAIVFSNFEFRKAKGILEALFFELNIEEMPRIRNKDSFYFFEERVSDLFKKYKPYRSYKEVSKYPPQFEDITVLLPLDTKVGEIIEAIKTSDLKIVSVELKDIFERNFTFTISYHSSQKTLTGDEVAHIRKKILNVLQEKLKLTVK